MYNSRNNNRNRRRGNRGGNRRFPNRRPKQPQTGAQGASRHDDVIHKRVFTRDISLSLTERDGDTAFQTFQLTDYMGRYAGTENLPGVYDQYKVTAVEVFAKTSFLNTPAASDTVGAQRSCENDTTVTSVLDRDSTTRINSAEYVSYTNCKEKTLCNTYRRLCVYRPNISPSNISLTNVVPRAQWLTTSDLLVEHIGFHGLFRNYSGAQFFSSTNHPKVLMKFRCHVSVKARRGTITTSVNSPFFDNFVGSTITITPPVGVPTVETVQNFRYDQAGFRFRYISTPPGTWLDLAALRLLIRNSEDPSGSSAVYSGPQIPSWIPPIAPFYSGQPEE